MQDAKALRAPEANSFGSRGCLQSYLCQHTKELEVAPSKPPAASHVMIHDDACHLYFFHGRSQSFTSGLDLAQRGRLDGMTTLQYPRIVTCI